MLGRADPVLELDAAEGGLVGSISALAAPSPLEVARRSRGGPPALLSALDEDPLPELPVVLLEPAVLLEPEDARRNMGRSLSSGEGFAGRFPELFEESFEDALPPVLPEPELGRRRTGRSLSLSSREELAELSEELFDILSEFEFFRRSTGWSPPPSDDRFEALVEDPEDPLPCNGRDVSSIACDAAACSSRVPSLTIVTFCAWSSFPLSFLVSILT